MILECGLDKYETIGTGYYMTSQCYIDVVKHIHMQF